MLNRSELSEPEVLPPLQEDEFLPPMSRWITVGALLLVGMLAGGVALASLIRYNITVQAIATVRPVDEVSVVQATAAGTIQRILVQENQPVQPGDVIAELGAVDRSRLAKLQARRQQLQNYIQQYQTQTEQIDQKLQALNPQNTAEQRDRFQQQKQSLIRQIRYDQETLQAIEQELGKWVIAVPIKGILFKLELRNPGQTVQPGDVVAQIVPSHASLIVKARVGVQDISQVEVGQLAQLRISAYPYPDYGILSGTVQAIAPDVAVVREPTTGITTSYYEILIQPDQPYLTKGDRQYPLQPGMEARVDIISRQETAMQSFLRKLRLWADV
ncbi:MAG: HlyD family efflux transporter periplasmic adaptor subunit [Leptolyngbyaceae cyanobacterium bins.302]|nr:HlyD family efflux transporter periplasmic adaptor subunit [Leptolyngbyaceae cyanobacterium bins.302]